MRRRKLAMIALLAALLGLTAVCGSVWGAFSAETINAGNEVIASADRSPPEVTSSVIAKTQGGTPGFIRQGGTYFVYANAIDAGSPASGVASVSGDLSTISTGMASAPLAPGSFSIGEHDYTHRGASLTARTRSPRERIRTP